MKNQDAARQTAKHQKTLLSETGGVSKAARRKGGKAVKARSGKTHRVEQGNRCIDDPAPRIVALIPASRSASAGTAIDRILEACCTLGDAHSRPSAEVARAAHGSSQAQQSKAVTLRLPASCGGAGGSRVTLLQVDTTQTSALLDALKVADCAVLVHHGTELPAPSCSISSPIEMLAHADKRGGLAIACMRAQGLPSLVIAAATGTNTLPEKTRHAARKVRGKLLHAEGLGEEASLRSYELDQPSQAALVLRMISTRALAGPAWRRPYSYMLAANATFFPQAAAGASPPVPPQPPGGAKREDRSLEMYSLDRIKQARETVGSTVGSLFVEGYVRARPLSANQLVHITGVGTFKLACIAVAQGGSGWRGGVEEEEEEVSGVQI